MHCTIDRVWSMEVPAAWETALREFSPVRTDRTWLAFRWFPMRRQIDGMWRDCGRWVLYECVPEALIPEIERDIVDMLSGPPPSTLPPMERRSREVFVDDWTCAMYRQHRVWPRPCWILQGDRGGHAVEYAPVEQAILKAKGLPVEPPAVGMLPYAPFDARAIAQLTTRNRLIRLGNDLDRLKRSGKAAEVEREWQDAQKAFRSEYVQFLEEQQAPQADFMDWYSRTTECRELIPEMTAEQRNIVSVAKDVFVETGVVPHAA